jgi:tyrosyl-tRNA synthetase
MIIVLKSDFLTEAKARGFINQATDLEGLDAAMNAGRIVAYSGSHYDASSFAKKRA